MRLRIYKVREKHPPLYDGEVYLSARQISVNWRDRIGREPEETFLAIYLDARHRYIGHREISRGSLTTSIVHPREVFKGALLANAGALVLVHNHPSGDPRPSDDDVAVTRRLREAADLLGLRVLDHVIIGDPGYTSFAETGLMA